MAFSYPATGKSLQLPLYGQKEEEFENQTDSACEERQREIGGCQKAGN
jgi:hypothetical protein